MYGHHQYSIYSSTSIDQISSMSIVHINYCRYQPFPIPKLIIQCCQTNTTRQQLMFQELNKKSIGTRLHMFFSSRRIRRSLFFLFYISPNFIGNSPQFGQIAVRLSFPSCSPCYNMFTEKVMKHSMLAKNEVSKYKV